MIVIGQKHIDDSRRYGVSHWPMKGIEPIALLSRRFGNGAVLARFRRRCLNGSDERNQIAAPARQVPQQRHGALGTCRRRVGAHDCIADCAYGGLQRVAQCGLDLALAQRHRDVLDMLDRKMNLRRYDAARLKNRLNLFDGGDKIGKPAGNGRGQFLERLPHRRFETGDRLDKFLGIGASVGILGQNAATVTDSHNLGSGTVRVLARFGQNIQRRQKLVRHRSPRI